MASWKDKAWFLPYAALTSLLYLFCAYILDVFLLLALAHRVGLLYLRLRQGEHRDPLLFRIPPSAHSSLSASSRSSSTCDVDTPLAGTRIRAALHLRGSGRHHIYTSGGHSRRVAHGCVVHGLWPPDDTAPLPDSHIRHERGPAAPQTLGNATRLSGYRFEAALLWLNVMAWVFYLPNLIVAEIIIWRVWGYGEAVKADDGARVG
eukprot:CAMPEP_0177796592 /NCGR_PEP_ID=MMETSP0491_2-20121128/26858_1 /TAXON_ID=63592 /ORGANISM="Tetraselmis chuii, Strain PLY429" /LENGTH=204 /DNA_ID=CAMNT_0019319519 /DNA_START=81 /DNA_END=692 /DNA_ORIENTATION=-